MTELMNWDKRGQNIVEMEHSNHLYIRNSQTGNGIREDLPAMKWLYH